ncbi:thermonuclease family protein [Polaribacter sp. Hel1_85]|uniref:thermonuclease family protein n=1 Tax=Polaribacter sp. Hel1_85 TaxID=1250005 RepID=UPI00052DB7F2|nr:thermonuclease family protein [Polaribacter sp. Hel1_85]KGL62931.1 SNase-like nuclease [Polaribacter sp. Hel1_85]
MQKIIFLLFLTILLSCHNNSVNRQNLNEFTAKVIGIKDGDTIEVLFENKPIIIRLEHIDCPEKRQPFGKKAKQFVSDNIFGKQVIIISKGKIDRWKRLIAVVEFENGENLNKLLVLNGLAMHFKKYSKDISYNIIEKEARQNKVGMWSQQNVIEPWNFRNN